MKLDKVCSIDNFSYLYENNVNEKLPHSIKLVVDDIIVDVNKVILCWWSDEFYKKADEDSEIYLTEFIGYKDQIKDCVSLLHGQYIAVDLTNIPVILKFAEVFKIPELTDAALTWFKENISLFTFVNIVNIVSDLEKVGYKLYPLICIIRKFVEENAINCLDTMMLNFNEDMKTVIDILIYDGPMVKEGIRMFNSKGRLQKDYKYLIDKLENISPDDETIAGILGGCVGEVKTLMNNVIAQVNHPQLLKEYTKFSRHVPTESGVAPSSSTDPVTIVFQSWRRLQKCEILDYKTKRNLGISEYQYAVICLDWIGTRIPPKEAADYPGMLATYERGVLELYNSLDQQKLAYEFVFSIRYMLSNILKHATLPVVQRQAAYEYSYQGWNVSEREIGAAMDNYHSTVKLKRKCFMSSCPKIHSNYVVKIRLVVTAGKVNVVVLPVPNSASDEEHTHSADLYTHWYLGSSDYSENHTITPFYTKSHAEIVEYLRGSKITFGIYCLIRKK